MSSSLTSGGPDLRHCQATSMAFCSFSVNRAFIPSFDGVLGSVIVVGRLESPKVSVSRRGSWVMGEVLKQVEGKTGREIEGHGQAASRARLRTGLAVRTSASEVKVRVRPATHLAQ